MLSWLFRLLSNLSRWPSTRVSRGAVRHALRVEHLEPRDLPSIISGYVFHDLNNNGLRDSGEPGLAGINLELRNSLNQVIATTVTGSNGYYVFDRDMTIPQTEQVITRTINFPDTRTNTSTSLNVPQFDPSLGRLTAVEILIQGRVATTIQVENLDPSPAVITANFSGSLTFNGPGLNTTVTTSSDTITYNAGAYDGSSDFAGLSGATLGPRVVTGSRTLTLTDVNSLSAWTGNSTVTITATGRTNSSATGGNILVQISALAGADVTIRYRYIPSNALRPGNYTIRQLQQPVGYLDGLESQGGSIIPGTVGTDTISVALGNQDSLENNFAEIRPSVIQGFVYHDINANGIRDPNEPGIAGVVIQLNGTNDLGQNIQSQVVTNADGSYRFDTLRPGIYNLQQVQPQPYLDGRESIEPLSGLQGQGGLAILGNDTFSQISVVQDRIYGNYNFGEVLPASLQGTVFVDNNLNGIRDPDELGIANVVMQLDGIDDLGNVVQLSTMTAADGSYQFSGLRPGIYSITQLQPSGYIDGICRVGSAGGTVSANSVSQINMRSGVIATGYDFAEVVSATLGGWVYHDANNDGRRDSNERGIANVEIILTGTDFRGNYVERKGSTTSLGRFLFENLAPGSYAIYQVQPTGYLDGKQTVGALGGTVQANLFTGINVRPGSVATDYLFGELVPGSLSGYVYLDTNRNGTRDSGDRGLAGVTIILTGTNDLGQSIRLTTKTTANGSYVFRDLRPGVYAIYEVQPSGYNEGNVTIGSLGGQKSGTNLVTHIRLSSGQNGTNYNFGETEPIKPSVTPPSLPSKRNFIASRRRR